jgi:hypothetical protein
MQVSNTYTHIYIYVSHPNDDPTPHHLLGAFIIKALLCPIVPGHANRTVDLEQISICVYVNFVAKS